MSDTNATDQGNGNFLGSVDTAAATQDRKAQLQAEIERLDAEEKAAAQNAVAGDSAGSSSGHGVGIGTYVSYLDGKADAAGGQVVGILLDKETDENGNEFAVIAELPTRRVDAKSLTQFQAKNL